MKKERAGPQVEVLKQGKADFYGIRQELSKTDWGRLVLGKGDPACNRLLNVRVRAHDQQVPLKENAGRRLFTKIEVYSWCKASKSLEEYRGLGIYKRASRIKRDMRQLCRKGKGESKEILRISRAKE